MGRGTYAAIRALSLFKCSLQTWSVLRKEMFTINAKYRYYTQKFSNFIYLLQYTNACPSDLLKAVRLEERIHMIKSNDILI